MKPIVKVITVTAILVAITLTLLVLFMSREELGQIMIAMDFTCTNANGVKFFCPFILIALFIALNEALGWETKRKYKTKF
jgi:hypothetical protein